MTSTLQELPPSRPTGRRRTAWLLGMTVLGVAVIAVGIVVSRGDTSSTASLGARQMASINQACRQWTGSSAPSVDGRTASAACTEMSGWMNQQLRGGHMTGPMMWGNATTMRDTCRQWMATHHAAASGSDAQSWCDDMVTWMTQHIGNWESWTTNGHMMGR